MTVCLVKSANISLFRRFLFNLMFFWLFRSLDSIISGFVQNERLDVLCLFSLLKNCSVNSMFFCLFQDLNLFISGFVQKWSSKISMSVCFSAQNSVGTDACSSVSSHDTFYPALFKIKRQNKIHVCLFSLFKK